MKLLETIEIETGPNPTASVIWLHGLGADAHDFEPIVPELGRLPHPVRFVFPNAPVRPITINGGMAMRAWYDITEMTIAKRHEDEAGVRTSQAQIEALMAREKVRGTPALRMVLAGFSQGGAIAFQTALRHPERLAGIMGLSTYLPLADKLAGERSSMNSDVPIFMAHGVHDPMIAVQRARESRGFLESLDYTVEWHDYPMEHSVCPAEIADIGTWLRRVLA
jgi:phospholipase/carboxylesterase